MKNVIYLLAAISFYACNSGNEENNQSSTSAVIQSAITPLLEGDFANSTLFTIDANVANTLETPNGSSIDVPANCLVDANGEPVKGKVNLTFNQYHSIPEILASGIPMDYDTLGQTYGFESAGMFSLKGTQNEVPVFVKEGESIGINLASDKSEARPFNFYTLNENTGDWTYEHSNSPVRGNPKFDPATYPKKPQPVSEDAFVLDINFDLSNYSELTLFSGIVWEYTGKEDHLDPRKNPIVNSTTWTDFELEPTHNEAYEYHLTMSNGDKKFTTQVRAALEGEDMELALAEFKTKKTEMAKLAEELQKPYIRSVSIGGFGTYNYDYIYKIEEPAQIIADFDFGTHNDQKEKALVAVVYEDEEVVVNYPKEKWPLFGLNTQAEPKIIAVLPGNRLAVCKEDVTNAYGKEAHTFKMKVLDETIDDKNSLIDAIASL